MAILGFGALLSVIFYMLAGKTAAVILLCTLLAADVLFCILHAYRVCRIVLLITAAAVCAALAFFWQESAKVAPSMQLLGQTVLLDGEVGAVPENEESGRFLLLERCRINGTQTKLKIKLYGKTLPQAQIGDTVTAGQADIFAAAGENEFYYHTLSEGCWLRAYAEAPQVTDAGNPAPIYRIRRFSHSVSARLFSSLGAQDGSIAAALLLGNGDALSSAFRTKLRVSGASHMFAVSGMHLSLWSAVLFFILRKRIKSRLLPNVATILFVLFYVIITGFSPSVMRAGVMMILVYSGKILKRQSDPINSLGIAALLLLGGNIYLAGNISFLLSFTAMLGIIILFPSFRSERTKKDTKPILAARKGSDTVLMSLSVLLTTAPVSAFFFGSISLLSPLSSILCSAPVAFVILSAFFGLCIGYVPFLSRWAMVLCGAGCKAIDTCVSFLARFDFCVCPVKIRDLCIWYAATAAVMIVVYFRFGRERKKVILSLLSCVILLLTVQIAVSIANRNITEIHIPACGNETSISVTEGNGVWCAQIGVGSSYDTVQKTERFYKTKAIISPDLLVLPRDSAAEAGNLKYYLSVPPAHIYTAGAPELLQGTMNVSQADSFTLELPKGVIYENRTSSLTSAGLLKNSSIKIVFSFYPGGDFQELPQEYKTGTYLICRGGLPANIDRNNFETVIVLSNKTARELQLPEGVFTTADLGDITIKTSVSR